MKLTLHPDPGTGHYWRLTLEVAGIELSEDVAPRAEANSAQDIGWRVARCFGLTEIEAGRWERVAKSRDCAKCTHKFAGGTHHPGGKGCDIVVNGKRCGCMESPP